MNQTIDSTYIHAILKMAYAQLMVDCNGPYRTIIAVKFGPDVTLDEGTHKVGELVRRLQTQLRGLARTEEFPSIRGLAMFDAQLSPKGVFELRHDSRGAFNSLIVIGDHELMPKSYIGAKALLTAFLNNAASSFWDEGGIPPLCEVISSDADDEEFHSAIHEALQELAPTRMIECVGPYGLETAEQAHLRRVRPKEADLEQAADA